MQNILSSGLLPKNLKINIYRCRILPVVLYGCDTWSLTLREERRLRVSENRVLMRIFGPKRNEALGEWRKLHNEEFNDLHFLSSIVQGIKSGRMRWWDTWDVCGRGEADTGFWWGNLRERDHLGDPDVGGRILLRWIFRKWDVGVWTGSS